MMTKQTKALAKALAKQEKAHAKIAEKLAKAHAKIAEKQTKAHAKIADKLAKAQEKTDAFKDIIDHVHGVILNNPTTILLRIREVLQWIYGDTSFLSNKQVEDQWGQTLMKTRRPDLKMDKQWTNLFGEMIAEELLRLTGKTVSKPANKTHYQPDLEIDDAIIEVKTQTFYTEGTAGEKILGCPFKYADIPELYGKPLKILCIGGAEKVCRERYGNLTGTKCSTLKQEFLEFYRSKKIEYIAATDLLNSL